ncbi:MULTISPECIES: PRD domain-containing protein [Clostridium]|uniref:BglG family transcriptional antiterminator n=1 Tax=Clostridium intestinale URNW TaxID=1294142 RepID=U2N8H0_9CLOT|nr:MULTISPECIES: PRD domain-containing protein [Clostridium]ERK31822.1 BglG family transcriptional antiterminator [Clostridium intestinale URNW]
MGNYIIKKVLNNNVVIAEKDKEEFVLVGNAIGFNTNKGKKIEDNRIENIFVKQSEKHKENFNKVLENVSSEIIGISEEIISLCEKELNVKLSEAIHVSLPDHINFAIRRVSEGINIENPFLSELEALYPREYRLAETSLNMINRDIKVNLPKGEIGFICMHIKAAMGNQNVSDTLAYTRKIGEVMEFLYKLLNKPVDRGTLSYVRTITHLNFMIERVIKKKYIKNELLDNIKKEYYNQYDIAIKVAMKIENIFSLKVPEDEIGYMALHINRIKEM